MIKRKISTEEIKKVFSTKNADAIVDLIWSYDFGRLQETYIFDQFQNDELRETLLRHETDEEVIFQCVNKTWQTM
ncbi:hypothetical protein LCGC14_1077950 [marine sediment metagenome]|uniref:Uncharacterized protein n=1 Tax=marine sediment metagenome TaxID=412755 RepID=A0A0F9MKZ1_9ZZZZ|nr:hypothetical protein [archaeon]